MRSAIFWLMCAACTESPDLNPDALSDCLSDSRDPATMSGSVRTTVGVLHDPCDSVDLLLSREPDRWRGIVCWRGDVRDPEDVCRWSRPGTP